jgi:acetone carboxylase gamma subunit
MALLKFAEENGGSLTYASASAKLSSYKDKDRFTRAIKTLLEDGLAWEDSQTPDG